MSEETITRHVIFDNLCSESTVRGSAELEIECGDLWLSVSVAMGNTAMVECPCVNFEIHDGAILLSVGSVGETTRFRVGPDGDWEQDK